MDCQMNQFERERYVKEIVDVDPVNCVLSLAVCLSVFR